VRRAESLTAIWLSNFQLLQEGNSHRQAIERENFTPSKNSSVSNDSDTFGICIPISPRSTTMIQRVELW